MIASVAVPELVKGINFFPSPIAPMFSVIAVLGVVPDLFSEKETYRPSHVSYTQLSPVMAASSWLPCAEGSQQMELPLQLPSSPADDNFSLILSVGIRYGEIGGGNIIKQKAKAGCGRVMAVA
jgi:hypothetical protein